MSLILLRTDCNGSNHYSYFSLHLSHFFLPSILSYCQMHLLKSLWIICRVEMEAKNTNLWLNWKYTFLEAEQKKKNSYCVEKIMSVKIEATNAGYALGDLIYMSKLENKLVFHFFSSIRRFQLLYPFVPSNKCAWILAMKSWCIFFLSPPPHASFKRLCVI